MVAPASMRAISSRRAAAARLVTRVATRRPLSIESLAIRKCPAARAATCGAWGDGQHLYLRGKSCQTLADRIGDGAADTRVDLVEDERRRRTAIGEHDFQRQHEACEFAAGGDFHQRTRPAAGIGLDPELDLIDPVGPVGFAFHLGEKARRVEFQGREFRRHRLVEIARGFLAPGGEDLRCLRIGGFGRPHRFFELDQACFAGVEACEIGCDLFCQSRQRVGGHAIFAARGAQREKPVLNLFQFARIEPRIAQGLIECRACLIERV